MDALSKLLKRFPIKTIMIAVIVVVILSIGIGNVYMATGNDTLVKSTSDVYEDNQKLEEEFGGEAIMVLYEADKLLTPRHLEHMKGLENELRTNDSIYTMISPVTLVEEIAGKQSDTFLDGISEIIDGIDDMGSKLIRMSEEIGENAQSDTDMKFPDMGDFEIPKMKNSELPVLGGITFPELTLPGFGDIELPDMDLSDLNKVFTNMIMAQEKLGEGTENLLGGYDGFSKQLNEVGGSLYLLSENMEDSLEKEQLEEVGEKISGLAKQMSQVLVDTGKLPTIPDQTIAGLKNIQEKLKEQSQEQQNLIKEQQNLIKEQQKLEEQMQAEMQKKQQDLKQIMNNQQESLQKETKQEMQKQQVEKEAAIKEFKNGMEKKQVEQVENLSALSEGLSKMGGNLKSISKNMLTIKDYSDIMSPGIPEKQTTLDNMIYDHDGELHTMFEEVVLDDNHMMMMIKFNGNTSDSEKSDVVNTISTYLDTETMDSLYTIVSGKPVLDNSIRSSMQESIQQMMAIALLIMIVILFFVFKVRWRLLPLFIVLIAVVGTIGLMGWLKIPITMVSMAVFPILIGLGIDYAIQFQTRYTEEMAKENSNE